MTNGHIDDKLSGQNGVAKVNGHAVEKMNGHVVGKMNGLAAGDSINGYSDKAGARAAKANGHHPQVNGAVVNGDAHETELDEFDNIHRMDLGSPKIAKVAVKI